MQPMETFGVPRRTLDVEDYIDILRRHKGWIFGPFLATVVISVVAAYLWPDSYVSEAVIQIKPQQISQSLVPTMTNQDIQDRINSLSNQVLSRSALSAMILNMGLYPRERNRMPMEDVQEMMRRSIRLTASPVTVAGGRSLPAFQVAFNYRNRHDAMKVVQTLASNFVAEDMSTTGAASFQQVELMQSIRDEAEKRLQQADQKLTDFRLANPGKLPDQLQANMTQLTAMQSQVQSLTTQLSQATSEKLGYENQIQLIRSAIDQVNRENKAVETAAAAAAAVPSSRPKSSKVQVLEARVDNARTQLATAQQQYKDAHPVVKSLKSSLQVAEADLDKARQEEAAQQEVAKTPEVAAANPANLANQRQVHGMELNIQNLEFNIKAKEGDIQRLQKMIGDANNRVADLNGKIQSMPVGDQVWQDLLREQALAKEQFMQADTKLQAAKTSADVNNRNQGEKLEILDAASLPQDPVDPNRPVWISVGAGLGLVLGVVLAGAREMKDTSLKNLKDVRAYTQMAVLGSVPLLENDFVVRRRRRISWLGWTVACLTAVLVMAGSIVYYYTVTKGA